VHDGILTLVKYLAATLAARTENTQQNSINKTAQANDNDILIDTTHN
jgi:hypothetical protein